MKINISVFVELCTVFRGTVGSIILTIRRWLRILLCAAAAISGNLARWQSTFSTLVHLGPGVLSFIGQSVGAGWTSKARCQPRCSKPPVKRRETVSIVEAAEAGEGAASAPGSLILASALIGCLILASRLIGGRRRGGHLLQSEHESPSPQVP